MLTSPIAANSQTSQKGILFEDCTWIEAEKVLTKDTREEMTFQSCALE